MRKVALFSLLLVAGMVLSQILPALLGSGYDLFGHGVRLLTMAALAFIMIHVGYEFDIDKKNVRQYGWDYVVAMTAAAFPWALVSLYFVFAMLPADLWTSLDAWKESLLAGRFAAPTSAGVLFAMLAAAGLSSTWLFRKARILAIFDDLDTVLLMIPLKIMMVGLAWQLGLVFLLIVLMLWLAWRFMHKWHIPSTWPWVLGYGLVIAGVSEAIYSASRLLDDTMPIHIEVLLPAFALGVMIRKSGGHEHHPASAGEERASNLVSGIFMVLVGIGMPSLVGYAASQGGTAAVTAQQPMSGWGAIALHVLLITVLSNLGKMFPAFCYRREATWRERLALSIGLWPRGEVGAGVLILSLSYGLGGPIVTVAMMSLALNLLLTGVFIVFVKRLLSKSPAAAPAVPGAVGLESGANAH